MGRLWNQEHLFAYIKIFEDKKEMCIRLFFQKNQVIQFLGIITQTMNIVSIVSSLREWQSVVSVEFNLNSKTEQRRCAESWNRIQHCR